MWRVLAILCFATTAWAQRPEVAPLVARARALAHEGRCIAFSRVARRIEELDTDYYRQTFVFDPEVGPCFDDGDDYKSPGTAIGLSLGTTLAGAGMLAVASSLDSKGLAIAGGATLFIGPTVGQMYAGRVWNAGLATRLAALALGGVGFWLVVRCEDGCNNQGSRDVGEALEISGLFVYVGASLYESIDAGRTAADYNRALTVTPAPGGAAVSFSGRF
jgi:hypothetical protein